MTPQRLLELTGRYANVSVAVVGDFCLDRYLEIDPAREEISIETGLPAHQVVRVRSQPGAAGTVMNNIVALGVKQAFAVGIRGDDGEGYELHQALIAQGVDTSGLIVSPDRRTFTYTKPLVVKPGELPRELSRLDIKNWTPTPSALADRLIAGLDSVLGRVQAVIVMDQVSEPDRGAITARVRDALADRAGRPESPFFLADSRRFIGSFRNICLKLNRHELRSLYPVESGLSDRQMAEELNRRTGKPVFVTLSEDGVWSVDGNSFAHSPPVPIEGPIDVVGAGDSVSANVSVALAAGATPKEAAELGNLAGSVVVGKIGTTGTASVAELLAAQRRRQA